MNTVSRRVLLGGALGIAGAAALAGCAGGPSAPATPGGPSTVRMAWWGNQLRRTMTEEAIKLHAGQHPDITLVPEPSEFATYWDRLATQTAASDMPDMIQMADGYIAEYGKRGALLDLEKHLDVSKFAAGTVDVGRVNGKLVGINAGINAPSLICNLAVLEKAGIERPDDTTWTWDQYRDLAAAITEATPEGVFGSATPGAEGVLRAWLRQHGQELFTTEGKLGATEDTMRSYFDYVNSFATRKAMPGAAQVVEDGGKPLEESPVATGKAAFALWWSNQYSALTKVSKDELVMLRMPSLTGKAADLNAWYHPSMLWSASAKTKNPEVVGQVIDWFVNSPECGAIILDDRGRPANTDVLAAIQPKLTPAGQKISEFLTGLEPTLGAPQPVPPPGSGRVFSDILPRIQTDLSFGRVDVAGAAKQFVAESASAIS